MFAPQVDGAKKLLVNNFKLKTINVCFLYKESNQT